MKVQKSQLKFADVIKFRNKMKKKYPTNHRYGDLSKYLKEVPVKCTITENNRKFSNGIGNAINKLTIEVDLSKSKHPWQPHDDQAYDFAEAFTDFLNEQYLDYCTNMQ